MSATRVPDRGRSAGGARLWSKGRSVRVSKSWLRGRREIAQNVNESQGMAGLSIDLPILNVGVDATWPRSGAVEAVN
jgi:hypothetical protein